VGAVAELEIWYSNDRVEFCMNIDEVRLITAGGLNLYECAPKS